MSGKRWLGVDVSDHNGSGVDWGAVGRSGVRFAVAKATDGASGKHSTTGSNVRGGSEAGLTMLLYHFAYPQGWRDLGVDAREEAENFVRVWESLADWVRPVAVLDWEDSPYLMKKGQSMAPGTVFKGRTLKPYGAARSLEWVETWFETCERGGLEKKLIYTGDEITTHWSAWPAGVELWHPHWVPVDGSGYSPARAMPQIPLPLPPGAPEAPLIWQFTDSGRVPGLDGNYGLTDVNEADGAAFSAFVGAGEPPGVSRQAAPRPAAAEAPAPPPGPPPRAEARRRATVEASPPDVVEDLPPNIPDDAFYVLGERGALDADAEPPSRPEEVELMEPEFPDVYVPQARESPNVAEPPVVVGAGFSDAATLLEARVSLLEAQVAALLNRASGE